MDFMSKFIDSYNTNNIMDQQYKDTGKIRSTPFFLAHYRFTLVKLYAWEITKNFGLREKNRLSQWLFPWEKWDQELDFIDQEGALFEVEDQVRPMKMMTVKKIHPVFKNSFLSRKMNMRGRWYKLYRKYGQQSSAFAPGELFASPTCASSNRYLE